MRYLLFCLMLLVVCGCSDFGPKPANPKKKSIVKKLTQEVVNAKEELQKEHIVQVVNKVQGNDPISQSTSAYIATTSQMSTAFVQQAIMMFEIENNHKPTYDEFMNMVKTQHIQFAMLPPYQTYGYDEDAGEVIVLEDTKDKKERYNSVGLDEDGNRASD